MSLTGWRGHLVAMGFDQEWVTSGTMPENPDLTEPYEVANPWIDQVLVLARRESQRGTDTGHIIGALLDLLSGSATERTRLRNELNSALNDVRDARRQLRTVTEDRDHQSREADRYHNDLNTAVLKITEMEDQQRTESLTEQNAALVGHQVGAFIGAGRKVIRVSELDLPEEWR